MGSIGEKDALAESSLTREIGGKKDEVSFLLTGFGPFIRRVGTPVTANPSYLAIKPLENSVYITKKGHKIRFTTVEIPVGYKDVDSVVPGFHEKGKFDFIVHLGVGLNGSVRLEQVAHSGEYSGQDIHGEKGPWEGDEVYHTTWNVPSLVNQLREADYEAVFPSSNAGRYLCEYIFYKSLKESQESGIPVLFVHVPDAGLPYSILEMTELIISLTSIMVDMKL